MSISHASVLVTADYDEVEGTYRLTVETRPEFRRWRVTYSIDQVFPMSDESIDAACEVISRDVAHWVRRVHASRSRLF